MTAVEDPASGRRVLDRARGAVETGRDRLSRTLVWQVWERMLETEFIDRSVALAGKAFVSFFPLVIVVAAFMPDRIRASIFTSLTSRLGVRDGEALSLSKEAFSSADDIRRATGLAGLFFTFFFASSFTTALQRIYLRAWRRPRNLKVGSYTRGLIWLVALLTFMVLTGSLGRALGHGLGLPVFVVLVAALSVGWWWFSAWYLLLGHVRWRVLLPGAVLSAVLMTLYGASSNIWMPRTVTDNVDQFGFFGIALALVTWFSGASMCLIVGACAGPVLAEDTGPIGRLIRGDRDGVLVDGAPLSLGPPTAAPRLRDAFSRSDEDEDSVGDDSSAEADLEK